MAPEQIQESIRSKHKERSMVSRGGSGRKINPLACDYLNPKSNAPHKTAKKRFRTRSDCSDGRTMFEELQSVSSVTGSMSGC